MLRLLQTTQVKGWFEQYIFHKFVTYISNNITYKVSGLENKLNSAYIEVSSIVVKG